MTKEQKQNMLPLIQQWIDGKILEVKTGLPNCHWKKFEGYAPDFFSDTWQWRIKPEPREFWLVTFSDESFLPVACHSLMEAIQHRDQANGKNIINVIEKLED